MVTKIWQTFDRLQDLQGSGSVIFCRRRIPWLDVAKQLYERLPRFSRVAKGSILNDDAHGLKLHVVELGPGFYWDVSKQHPLSISIHIMELDGTTPFRKARKPRDFSGDHPPTGMVAGTMAPCQWGGWWGSDVVIFLGVGTVGSLKLWDLSWTPNIPNTCQRSLRVGPSWLKDLRCFSWSSGGICLKKTWIKVQERSAVPRMSLTDQTKSTSSAQI